MYGCGLSMKLDRVKPIEIGIGMALELDDLPVRYEYPHAVQD